MINAQSAIIAAALLITGCGGLTTPTAEQPAEANEAAEVAEAPAEDFFALGKTQGYEAAVAAQTASGLQWQVVGGQWDTAISTLGQVPPDSPDYAAAQAKASEYTANRGVAAERQRLYEANLAVQKAAAEKEAARYRTYTADAGLTETTEVQWRWLESNEFSCDYGTCWGMELIAPEGCDSALYVELSLMDESDINVGMTNDTTGKIGAGQKARLTFNAYDDTANKARISEMNCY